MKPSEKNRLKSGDGRLEAVRIVVVGDHTFNNDVLASFLGSQTGFSYYSLKDAELHQLWDKISGRTCLLFLDCATMINDGMGNPVLVYQKTQYQNIRVVWFNADQNANIENIALRQGVKGILYANQPAEHYTMAAKAVLRGELWYPREILEKMLMDTEAAAAIPAKGKALLTRRERGILNLVALGMKNREIADELCISTHTVKTHIYNMYRKINVDNRFKAVQWLLDDQPG